MLDSSQTPRDPRDAEAPRVWRLLLAGAFRFVLGMPVIAALIFAPAGTLRWPAGWRLFALLVVCAVANVAVLLLHSPDVVAARMRPRQDARPRHTVVAAVIAAGALGAIVIAGLEFRYARTVSWPAWPTLLGLALLAAGDAIFVWAAAVNRFFTMEVAVQASGHVVVAEGPYRFVRHPGYIGFALMFAGIPLALESVWALAPGATSMVGLIGRTALEDAMLREELPGYADYASRVRYRLFPGLW